MGGSLRLTGFALVLAGCGLTSRNPEADARTGASTAALSSTTTNTGTSATLTGGSVADEFLGCSQPSECVVTFPGCCNHCEAPSRSNMLAVARASLDEYRNNACSADGACGSCNRPDNGYLAADCEDGRCVLVDLDEAGTTACDGAEDCKLRSRECCECGSSGLFIAIALAGESEYARLSCAPGSSCDDCELPIEVTDLGAICNDGRCRVVGFGP